MAVLLGLLVLGGLLAPAAEAQETRQDTTQTDTTQADSVRADTARTAPVPPVPADTVRSDSLRSDSLQTGFPERPGVGGPPGGGGPPGRGGEAGNAVRFSARDSLIITFGGDGDGDEDEAEDEEGDVGTLYGAAEVNQQDATLTAYEVQILFGRNELRATGPPAGVQTDSLGIPRFQRGEGEAFTGSQLAFNLDTRRGRVVKARTGYDDGFIQGDAVRIEQDSTVYVRGGRYTTCDCPRDETPSYSLRSGKMKKQGDWVYTGPIQLFIYNIPMPLVLPFAFLPAVAGRHGGILPPSYGQDNRLGFYLRDFGYYWPISDYMGVQLTGSLWSRGSWDVSPFLQYRRRYYYNGNLRVDYVRNIAGDVVDGANYLNRTNLSLRWTHQQWFIPRGAPNSLSLRANVNLSSQSYRQIASDAYTDNVTRETSSAVSFDKSWNDGNQQLTLKLRQRQNFTTENASLTLPSLSFNQRNVKPFQRDRIAAGSEERWYERITTSYRGELRNTFDFNPLDDEELLARGDTSAVDVAWYDALFSQDDYRRATGDQGQRFNFAATHRVPVRATFRLPRYQLNVTPNLNYTEEWFPSTTRVNTVRVAGDSLDSGDFVRRTRQESGFFATREFNLGVSSSTTFYGQFPLRVGALRGLRHEVQPSLSLTYAPDYSTDLFGRTRSYLDEDGEEVLYDITTGRDLRNPSGRRSVSFSIDNEFETKEVRIDSTGAEQEEILRLMTLDIRSGYNFAAEEFRLSDFSVRADFPVLDTKYNIDASARLTLSPYVYNEDGIRLNRLVLSETNVFPVSLTDFDLSVSTDFQGGDQNQRSRNRFARRTGVDRTTGGAPQVPDPVPNNIPGRPSLRQGVEQYANFEIPWSLRLRLNYGFTNEAIFEQSQFVTNADFSFNVTPRWKVSGVSGYDFDRGELTRTQFEITRDFQCWQMNFSWVPFGRRESYSFSLHVKSGVLRDLLNLRLPREGVRDRFRGVASGVTQGLTQ